METFGERLKFLREKYQLSQVALAKKLNTTAPTVSRWESDQQVPEIPMLTIIVEFFNTSLDFLILGKE